MESHRWLKCVSKRLFCPFDAQKQWMGEDGVGFRGLGRSNIQDSDIPKEQQVEKSLVLAYIFGVTANVRRGPPEKHLLSTFKWMFSVHPWAWSLFLIHVTRSDMHGLCVFLFSSSPSREKKRRRYGWRSNVSKPMIQVPRTIFRSACNEEQNGPVSIDSKQTPWDASSPGQSQHALSNL